MSDYRKLLVWRKAHELALAVYQVTTTFPVAELYGLTSQLRRASVSVAANIAEGSGRGTQRELARFCRISRGSLNELEYHLLLSKELNYLSDSTWEDAASRIAVLRRMLAGFLSSISART